MHHATAIYPSKDPFPQTVTPQGPVRGTHPVDVVLLGDLQYDCRPDEPFKRRSSASDKVPRTS